MNAAARKILGRLRRADGTAMVELALVLPLLMMLLTGILQFGLMYNKYISLTDAARIGARYVALSRGSSGDPCTEAQSHLKANEVTLSNLTFATPKFSGGEDCSDPGSWTQGDSVTFYISEPYTFHLYGIDLGTVDLSVQATDAIE